MQDALEDLAREAELKAGYKRVRTPHLFMGLLGTGSKDVVLDNVFIPDHYAVPMIEIGSRM